MNLDYSLSDRIEEYLIDVGIEYSRLVSNGIDHILVYVKDRLAIFMVYGFFEEYCIYHRLGDLPESWKLLERDEMVYEDIYAVLSKIGAYNINE